MVLPELSSNSLSMRAQTEPGVAQRKLGSGGTVIFLIDLVEGQFLVEAPPTELPQPTLQACMPVFPAVPHRWNARQLAGFSHQAGCEAGPGTSRTFGGLIS